MRVRFVTITSMFALGLALGTGALLANHAWICSGSTAYHWSTTTLVYANAAEESPAGPIGREVTDYTGAFEGAVGVWASPNTVINLTRAGTPLLRHYYDAYGRNGWLGLATIYLSGCTITRATTKLNDSYLRSTRYSQTNIEHVACQEVGHTFGLDHQDDATDTCMNDHILSAGNRINQHDQDQLALIYASIP